MLERPPDLGTNVHYDDDDHDDETLVSSWIHRDYSQASMMHTFYSQQNVLSFCEMYIQVNTKAFHTAHRQVLFPHNTWSVRQGEGGIAGTEQL